MQELESRTMFSASLVKDINTTFADANPQNFVAANGELYFTANDGIHGVQLWETNGTAAGTMPVTNLIPGHPNTVPSDMTAMNGELYFFAADGLWQSDGTPAGTVELRSGLNGGPTSVFGGILYFVSNGAIYRSDGTAQGTVEMASGFLDDPGAIAATDGTIYFTVGSDLWETHAQSTPVDLANTASEYGGQYGTPPDLIGINGRAFLFNGATLWSSDGTVQGTQSIAEPVDVGGMIAYNGDLYFGADDHFTGLFTSDGTADGTQLVASIPLVKWGQEPNSFAILNNTLYFSVGDNSHGQELWRSDGTAQGTRLVTDLNPGPNSGVPGPIITFNGNIYFAGTNGATGLEVWRSDGTSEGTTPVDQINQITNSSEPIGDVTIGNYTYFTADDGIDGRALWRTDGTAAGTSVVVDLRMGFGDFNNLFDFNGTLYFTAYDVGGNTDVWKTDDTAAGTSIVEQGTVGSYFTDFTSVGGKLFFFGTDPVPDTPLSGPTYLYQSDGTAAGTIAIQAVLSGGFREPAVGMAAMGGALYFTSFVSGPMSLWKADPAMGNPSELASFTGNNSRGSSVIAGTNTVYFTADGGTTGPAIWKSDGTPAGTSMVWASGSATVFPTGIYVYGNSLFFELFSPVPNPQGNGLYETDGTANGTVVLADVDIAWGFTAVNGKVYFVATPPGSNPGLYMTDGTPAGTRSVDPNMSIGSVYASGGLVYFSGYPIGSSEPQLWVTDGTTTTLADPSEPTSDWTPNWILGATNGQLLFAATDLAHGAELWGLPILIPSQLSDAGFESPSVGSGSYDSFAYDPNGSPWTFAGAAGISGNGSGFTALNPDAPEGSQVAFLQDANSTITQSVTLAAGTYTIDFQAAQRVQWQYGLQDFEVLVDGNVVGTFTPAAGGAYASYQTNAFAVGDGPHTITFKGLDSAGGDETAFIDAVTVAAAVAPPALADAGFESPSVGSGTYGSFAYDPSAAGWQFTGSAGISGNGSGFTALNADAPEGTQVGFIEMANAAISQTVALSAGTYTIDFQAAQRVQWQSGRQDFEILVDGKSVGTFNPAAGGAYASYQTAPFAVAGGTHTIEFLGLDSAGGDNTAFVDAITVTAAAAPPQPVDAGFEDPSVGSGSYGDFAYDPTGSAWQFAGSSGISGNGSGFTALNPNAPEGTQVAFLEAAGSSISQTVTLAAGTYAIDFQAAQRVQWQTGLQDFEVLVDGNIVGTFTPAAGSAYAAFSTTPINLGSGPHTITFQGLDTAGGDNTAFIDAVQIVNA